MAVRAFGTPRLRVRPLGEGDDALYCRLYTSAETMRHIGAPLSITAAQRAFRASCRHNQSGSTRVTWVMAELVSARDIGLLALLHGGAGAEIGVMLLDDARNRGYATEAIRALVDLAFAEPSLEYLYTRHAAGNGAMAGLMRKLAFAREPSGVAHQPEVRWRRDRVTGHENHESFAMPGTDR